MKKKILLGIVALVCVTCLCSCNNLPPDKTDIPKAVNALANYIIENGKKDGDFYAIELDANYADFEHFLCVEGDEDNYVIQMYTNFEPSDFQIAVANLKTSMESMFTINPDDDYYSIISKNTISLGAQSLKNTTKAKVDCKDIAGNFNLIFTSFEGDGPAAELTPELKGNVKDLFTMNMDMLVNFLQENDIGVTPTNLGLGEYKIKDSYPGLEDMYDIR